MKILEHQHFQFITENPSTRRLTIVAPSSFTPQTNHPSPPAAGCRWSIGCEATSLLPTKSAFFNEI